jgi:hypothetical protein
VTARANTAVVQQHLQWLKRDRPAAQITESSGVHPLWRSIYAVRTTPEGAVLIFRLNNMNTKCAGLRRMYSQTARLVLFDSDIKSHAWCLFDCDIKTHSCCLFDSDIKPHAIVLNWIQQRASRVSATL